MSAQPQSDYSSAMMPEKALMSVLGYMEDLTSIYSEELNAIALRDMKRFTELQPAKYRLVRDCELRMSEIAARPELYKQVSPALKERVFSAEATLGDLAKKSQRECQIRAESMERVQKRLLEAARYAVREKEKPVYNKSGRADMTKSRPVSTAINEAI